MMQGMWFSTDVFVLPLDNYDMVLGIQWLAFLDDIVWNFKKLTMKFSMQDRICELQGVGSNGVSLCSAEKMNDLLLNSGHLVAVHLCSIRVLESGSEESVITAPKVTDQPTAAIQQILRQFADVFSIPETLPPSRSCDHQIILKE